MNAHSEILTAEVVQSYINEITEFDARVTRLAANHRKMVALLQECSRLFAAQNMVGNAAYINNFLENVGEV